jgi:hypothetical protein
MVWLLISASFNRLERLWRREGRQEVPGDDICEREGSMRWISLGRGEDKEGKIMGGLFLVGSG